MTLLNTGLTAGHTISPVKVPGLTIAQSCELARIQARYGQTRVIRSRNTECIRVDVIGEDGTITGQVILDPAGHVIPQPPARSFSRSRSPAPSAMSSRRAQRAAPP